MERSAAPVIILLIVLSGIVAVALVGAYEQVEHLALFILVPVMFVIAALPIIHRIRRGEFDLFEVEFLDANGRAVAVSELMRSDLLVLKHEPALAA